MGVDGPRGFRRRFSAATVLAGCIACSDGATSANNACELLKDPIVLPATMRSVVERIVGKKPDVLAVLVTPWGSQDDVSVRVLLLPERSGEVDELERELRGAGFTVTAALDQREAHQEFAILFGARPDLVQSVEADDLPASIYLEAAITRERARLEAAVKDDPRVREVVPGDMLSPSFAPVLYEIVDSRLDRLERLLPADRAADVRTLRSLAARVRQREPSEPEAAVKAAVPVRQLEEFAASRCGLDGD